MRKRAGIVLCIIGTVLLIIAVIILFITSAHQGKHVDNNKDITEEMQETKDKEESNITTEYQEELKQETNQIQKDNDKNSGTQKSTEQSAHAINPEVYEWPCGRKHFQNMEEPRQVIEFAKYKKYYEQIAQQFLEYEGKDVEFYGDDDMFYFDECKNEGSVNVTYDKELMLDLFEKSRVDSVYVSSDYIIFETDVSKNGYIMYLYDETLTYNDPFPSEKDNLISSWMINIAPHWWWEDLGPGD